MLEGMLSYKAKELTLVPAQYMSQTCHSCGHCDRENRKTQAHFRCVSCGFEGNADVNAALNLLALGSGASGRRGTLTLFSPMSRQQLDLLDGSLH